jgi:hypothetical protein
MSRLYIRAKGARGELTRTAVDSAYAQILYNFDGKSDADGSMRLEAHTSNNRKEIVFTLWFTNENNGRQTQVGRWVIDAKYSSEIKLPNGQLKLC